MADDLQIRLAVLEERVLSMRENTALQAKEYERRLDELNHAHSRQREDQRSYVSQDKFDGHIGESNSSLATLRSDISALSGRNIGIRVHKQDVTGIVAIVIAILSVVVNLAMHFLTK